jgi:hypothetical protein
MAKRASMLADIGFSDNMVIGDDLKRCWTMMIYGDAVLNQMREFS